MTDQKKNRIPTLEEYKMMTPEDKDEYIYRVLLFPFAEAGSVFTMIRRLGIGALLTLGTIYTIGQAVEFIVHFAVVHIHITR